MLPGLKLVTCSRRLFLAYLHFLYESSHTDLLTKASNTDQDDDIDFCISFIWYRLTVYDLNVIFYLMLDIVQLYHPSPVSFSFGNCCITDHGIESATTVLINQAKVPLHPLYQYMPFGLVLYENQFTHHGVKSLARLVSADAINLYFLDISHNLVNDFKFHDAPHKIVTPVCN